METSAFNLDQAINDYVSEIAGQGSITDSDATELANHLEDSVAALRNAGLSDREAFTIARIRLGDQNELSDEFRKVNPSIKTNMVWAYALIGFNLFSQIPPLIFLLVGCFYIALQNAFGNSSVSISIATVFNLLFIWGVIILVGKKDKISSFIEEQVKRQPIRTICWAFLPFITLMLLTLVAGKQVQAVRFALPNIPVRTFGGLAEFSFYLAALSLPAALVALIFSINIPGRLTLRQLFQAPPPLLIFAVGVFSSVLAAATRVIHFPFDRMLVHMNGRSVWVDGVINTSASALAFGLIYGGGAFLVSFYTKGRERLTSVFIFGAFGIVVESIGIYVRLGGQAGAAAFVPALALIIGTVIGTSAGSVASKQSAAANS